MMYYYHECSNTSKNLKYAEIFFSMNSGFQINYLY